MEIICYCCGEEIGESKAVTCDNCGEDFCKKCIGVYGLCLECEGREIEINEIMG